MLFHTASLLGHFSFHRHEGLGSLWHGVITDRREEDVLVAGLAVQLLAVLVEGGGGQPLLALAALQTGAVVRGAV